MNKSIHPHLPFVALILLLGMVYSQTVNFEPVFDDAALFGPLHGTTPATKPSLSRILLSDFWSIAVREDAPKGSPYYRPIPALFIVMERSIGDIRTVRAVHTGLFLVAVCLLYVTVLRLFPMVTPLSAAIGCAFFSLFPSVPDTVLFLSSITDIFALILLLSALYWGACYWGTHVGAGFIPASHSKTNSSIKGGINPPATFEDENNEIPLAPFAKGGTGTLARQGVSGKALAGVTVFSLLAALSKETAYLLPLLFLAIHKWGPTQTSKHQTLYLFFFSTLAVSIAIILRTIALPSSISTTPNIIDALWAVSVSLRYTLLPYPQMIEVPKSIVPAWSYLLSAVPVLLLLLRKNSVTMAMMIWLILILPALWATATTGLFAQRYLTIPSIGLAMGIALGTTRLFTHSHRRFKIIIAAALLISTGMMIDRTVTWKDGITLWSVELGYNPSSITAHLNLANQLAEKEQYKEAFAIQMKTIELATKQRRPCQAAIAALNAAALLPPSQSHRATAILEHQTGSCPRLDSVIQKRITELALTD